MDCGAVVDYALTKAYCGSGLNGKRQCLKCSALRVSLSRHTTADGTPCVKVFNRKSAEEKQEYLRSQNEKRKDLANPKTVPYDFSDLHG